MRKYIILLIFYCGVFFCSNIYADTYVEGSITSNTTWNLSGSPYILSSGITVYNSTITIEPGVEVQLNGTRIQIGTNQNARLIADGVTFTGSGYIHLYYGPNQSIKNCTFNNSYLELRSTASGVIENNIINISSGNGINGSGTWTVTNNNISGGNIDIIGTFSISGGNITNGYLECRGTGDITGLTITGNGNNDTSGIRIDDCNTTILYVFRKNGTKRVKF